MTKEVDIITLLIRVIVSLRQCQQTTLIYKSDLKKTGTAQGQTMINDCDINFKKM